jgi:hypothetical protein
VPRRDIAFRKITWIALRKITLRRWLESGFLIAHPPRLRDLTGVMKTQSTAFQSL